MSKRTYNRRSDDQIIEDLESRIRELEDRKKNREQKASPVMKELPKLKKKLSSFAQLCVDSGRQDLANTILGFMSTLELQASREA